MENKLRIVSEYILAKVFYCLPYATVPFIACQNIKEAKKYVQNNMKDLFPAPRVFPKGTLGMYPTKRMHDDDNGAVSPSLWTSVCGDDNTQLSFHAVNFEVSLTTTTHRMCWFMGWIPHKTTTTTTKKKGIESIRINHSAYTKPDFEQFANGILHPTSCRSAISSIKKKLIIFNFHVLQCIQIEQQP